MNTFTSRNRVGSGIVVLSLLVVSGVWAGPRSGGSYLKHYVGRTGPDGGRLNAEITLDAVQFPLLSLANKYRVVRVLLRNEAGRPIRLSAANDGITLWPERDSPEAAQVKGIIDLRAADADVWDKLGREQREELAYPEVVEAAADAAARGGPGVAAVYVFFPADKVIGLPAKFSYRIASGGEAVILEVPPAAAR